MGAHRPTVDQTKNSRATLGRWRGTPGRQQKRRQQVGPADDLAERDPTAASGTLGVGVLGVECPAPYSGRGECPASRGVRAVEAHEESGPVEYFPLVRVA